MGKRVLLADDSATIQKLTEIALSDSDFELLAVSDGKQAVDQLESFRPDIVLVDAIMPVMDGYEVCQFMKNDDRYKHLPVILLRNRWQPYDEDRASAASVDREILKPYSQDQLMDLMNEFFSADASDPGLATESDPHDWDTDPNLIEPTLDEPSPEPEGGPGPNPFDGQTVKFDPEALESMAKRQGADQDGHDPNAELERATEDSVDIFGDETGETLELTTEDLEDVEPLELGEDDLHSGADLLEIDDLDDDALDEIENDLDDESPASDSFMSGEPLDVLEADDYEVVDDEPANIEPPGQPILVDDEDSEDSPLFEDSDHLDELDAFAEETDEKLGEPESADESVAMYSDDELELELEDTDELNLDMSSSDEIEDVLDLDAAAASVNPQITDAVEMLADESDEDSPILDDDFAVEPLDDEDDLLEDIVESDTAPVDMSHQDDAAFDLKDEITEPIDVNAEMDAGETPLEEDDPLSLDQADSSEIPTEIIEEPILEDLDDLEMAGVEDDFTTGPVTVVDDDEEPVVLDLPEEIPAAPEPVQAASDSIIQKEISAEGLNLSEEQLEKLADRVAERLIHKIGSDSVREIIWDIVPELAEAMIKKRIYQLEQAVDED